MKLTVIIPLSKRSSRSYDLAEKLLRRHAIDLTTLIEMTLLLWDEIEAGNMDIFSSSLNAYVSQHKSVDNLTFKEHACLLSDIRTALDHIYLMIDFPLGSLLSEIRAQYVDVRMSLKRFLVNCPVIEIDMQDR